MIQFGKGVVRFRIPILMLSLLLLVPSVAGYLNTRINYDILSYLPEDIETMKGQDILLDEFGTGAFSVAVVEGMEQKDAAALKREIEQVSHVKAVLWQDSLADISVPLELLPEDMEELFENKEKNATLMIVMLDTSMSADETLDAVEEIRSLTKQQCLLSGMSAVVADIKKICNSEAVMYVAIASGLSALVLALAMDSFLIPVLFLLSIGMAIIYNLGTNFVAGEISFITQALAAVLQLAELCYSGVFVGCFVSQSRETADDFAFGTQISHFGIAYAGALFLLAVEESVAGGGKTFPEVIGVFLGDSTDTLPFFLHGNEFIGCLAPVGAFLQSLGTRHKVLLVSEVRRKFLACIAVEFGLGGEETVAALTETCEEHPVHLL